jgi:hypothetical protein
VLRTAWVWRGVRLEGLQDELEHANEQVGGWTVEHRTPASEQV